jgi:hypothetical protein
MSGTSLAAALMSAAMLIACAEASVPDGPGDGEDDSFGTKADSLVTAAEVVGILALADTAAFDTLDDDVGLDVRAARHMVEHRAGADAVEGTGDDDSFDSLAELDAVKWVGPSALGKLRAYALENGYVDPAAEPGCLIISEYIEAWGQFNKAIELFNCGDDPAELGRYSICLVRNDDTDCTLVADLGTATLAPGAVTTVCRRRAYHPAGLDPIPFLAEACDLERAGAMTFSGDDRLLVLREDGTVADSLGRVGYRPPASTWANKVLDRCNLAPADGVSYYDHADYFTVRSSGTVGGYGSPPAAGCD